MKDPANKVRLIECFRDAFRGIVSVARTEPNFRIHLIAVVVLGVLGFFFQLTAGEWCAVLLAAAGVLVAEALNTAIEYLADAVHPEADPGVGLAKDAAAGAVCIAAIAAAVVGAIVFLPKLWALIFKLPPMP